MTQPSAKIIADSITEQGHRLTTMEVVMHRFILAEMNTHRAFSRNSASSRAIPYRTDPPRVNTIRERVIGDTAFPVQYGAEQKGMQSGDTLDRNSVDTCKTIWNDAKRMMIARADALHEMDLHKSLINRLLEPFMWHTAIVSATDWDNFFWQRCHPDAQPEMKAVADEMQRAYYRSTPKVLVHGEWHLPYISKWDIEAVQNDKDMTPYDPDLRPIHLIRNLKQISVARCARVSYLTQDGVRDHRKDLELFDRLKGSGHWSPFEHVATPARSVRYNTSHHPSQEHLAIDVYGDSSNFTGWKQFRKEFRDENRRNFVPNLPDLADIAKNVQASYTLTEEYKGEKL